MKVTRAPAPPPETPPFAPVVITLETLDEARIMRHLVSDAGTARGKAVEAVLSGYYYIGTGSKPSSTEINAVLQAFRGGLQDNGIRG